VFASFQEGAGKIRKTPPVGGIRITEEKVELKIAFNREDLVMQFDRCIVDLLAVFADYEDPQGALLGIRSAIYQEIHKLLEIAFEDLSALISRRALLDKSLRLWNRLSQRAAKRLKFLFRRYKSKALDSRPILLGKYGDVLCDLALVLAESVSGLAD